MYFALCAPAIYKAICGNLIFQTPERPILLFPFGSSFIQCSECFVHKKKHTQPQIYAHPYGGYMVMFGTGKLFEDTDGTDTKVQSLYGVWDTAGSVAGAQHTYCRKQRVATANLVFKWRVCCMTDVAVNWVTRGSYIIWHCQRMPLWVIAL